MVSENTIDLEEELTEVVDSYIHLVKDFKKNLTLARENLKKFDEIITRNVKK